MYEYAVETQFPGGKTGILKSDDKLPITFSSPPEFGGPEDYWTPETLFIASVCGCLTTTAMFLAKKKKIPVKNFKSRGKGVLEKSGKGLAFTRVEVQAEMVIGFSETDLPDAQKFAHTVEKYCLISNSINCPVALDLKILPFKE